MIVRFSQDLCNTIFQTRFEKTDDEGNVKMIRLIEGSNNVDESKQDKQAKQKQFKTGFANTRVGDESFYQTEITDKGVLNFLHETPYWGGKIQQYDPLAESKSKASALETQLKLLVQISEMKQEDLIALGYALKGKEALQKVKEKDLSGLKLMVVAEAQENPEEVASVVNDKSNADKLFVGLAMAKGVIVETDAGNSVSWGHNNARITSVPANVSPLDAMVEFFSTVEGREVKKQMFLKIGSDKAEKDVEKALDKAEADTEVAEAPKATRGRQAK